MDAASLPSLRCPRKPFVVSMNPLTEIFPRSFFLLVALRHSRSEALSTVAKTLSSNTSAIVSKESCGGAKGRGRAGAGSARQEFRSDRPAVISWRKNRREEGKEREEQEPRRRRRPRMVLHAGQLRYHVSWRRVEGLCVTNLRGGGEEGDRVWGEHAPRSGGRPKGVSEGGGRAPCGGGESGSAA